MMNIKVSSVVVFVALIAFAIFIGPFLLLVGINFIADPLGVQVPYTLGTWFGALLVILTMKTASSGK